jgi:MaoC dehydratase-like protein
MANKDAVGREGPRFDMIVERGKIREFAIATGSAHEAYLDDPEAVIPPTFLTTMTFWQPPEAARLYRDLDIDRHRLLHGEQEYVFVGIPPRAGARLHARTVVEEMYDKEGRRGGTMTFVVTRTDFVDDNGAVVAQARSTAIETGRPPAPPTEPQGD